MQTSLNETERNNTVGSIIYQMREREQQCENLAVTVVYDISDTIFGFQRGHGESTAVTGLQFVLSLVYSLSKLN